MFRVPSGSIGYWTHRFVDKGVAHEALERRFGEPTLSFTDPDGTNLARVGIPGAERETAWSGGIPGEYAIRGFHGVILMLDDASRTAAILSGVLGFAEFAREPQLIRLRANDAVFGGVVDIREAKGFLAGRMGRGSVHHVAFRAANDAAQAEMARKLTLDHGVHTTEQIDRKYFRSVYFREPGGVIFEIATDEPGFAVDEPIAALGRDLKLPSFLEPRRQQIEAALRPLERVA
jgi:glyoxalase family protein